MREIDMSREAVTARLKLVSQLRRLCLSLQTATIKPQSLAKRQDLKKGQRTPSAPEPRAK